MRLPLRSILCAALLLGTAPGLLAQPAAEPPAEHGWKHEAELGIVATSGNSESTSLGGKYTGTRDWAKALFTLKAGGIRVETTTTVRWFNEGNPQLNELEFDEVSAENYYVNARYDRNITERFFWYGSAGWDRNIPAGVRNRYIGSAGVGNVWHDRDDLKFRTYYGMTYTDQEDVVLDPAIEDTFAGLRAGWDYLNQLGESTTFTSVLVVDANVDESDDWRLDTINAVAVAMSERLALKVSWQLLYDNLPALVIVPVFPVGQAPGAGTATGTATIEADDLDQILSVSLVMNF